MRTWVCLLLFFAMLCAPQCCAAAESGAASDLVSPADISYGSWETIGSNDHGVLCLAWYDGMLFAGGTFSEIYGINGYITANGLAAWDGDTWRAVGWPFAPPSLYPVHALLVHDGELYAAAEKRVARWTGEGWAMVGPAFGGSDPYSLVHAMTTYAGQLVAAGNFTSCGESTINRIARWDGESWLPVGEGADASVRSLVVFGGELIAGGWFDHIGGQAIESIAAWNGSAWHALGTATPRPDLDALGVFGGYLIGLEQGIGAAKWDGSTWTSLGLLSSMPTSMIAFDSFLTSGLSGSNGLWRWEGATRWERITSSFGPIQATATDGHSLFVAGNDWCAGSPCYNLIRRWAVPLWAPQLADHLEDEGGVLEVGWKRHALESPSASVPIASYEVQRLDGSTWITLASLAAAQEDSYAVAVSTPDTLTVGETPPTSDYRIVARTADPRLYYESAAESGYSLDNLAPPAPTLILYDTETARVLLWSNPESPDFRETCLYRGSIPGFEETGQVLCTASTYYNEAHLGLFYYRARAFDRHGNPSEWSNEVVGQYPTEVPGATPTALRLYPNQPNPFNPVTTIRFDLPEDGRVRLRVYDVRGRLVRTLVNANIPRGSQQSAWDGRDSDGQAVASGVYFARLVHVGETRTIRMSLMQ